MAKKPNNQEHENYHLLVQKFEDSPPSELRAEIVKNSRIEIRVSENDKKDIKRTAKMCNLTVSEYILRLHDFGRKAMLR